MTSRPSKYPSFTIDYAIDQITDANRLRDLVRLFRNAMLSQHEFAGHLIAVHQRRRGVGQLATTGTRRIADDGSRRPGHRRSDQKN